MKVLCIEGYTHESGKTARLTDTVVDMLRGMEVSVESVGLRERTIADCTNCGLCTDDHVCPIRDDMERLYDKVKEADVLLVTTPVYMWGMTAPLKAFLDRLYAITDDLEDKVLAVAVTAGGDAFGGCDLVVQSLQRFADYFGMDMKDALYQAPSDDSLSAAQVEKFCRSLMED